jgi:D-alanyl-D-alanine carboxypeptidase (penicillin-binding protein 5/6)
VRSNRFRPRSVCDAAEGAAANLKPALERKDPLVAPVPLNSKVGTMKMMLDGKVV